MPSLRQIAQECIDASLALPEIPSVVHGDLCFSNVMYDSRSNSVKVIDPRGLNIQQELTIYGNQSYDWPNSVILSLVCMILLLLTRFTLRKMMRLV